MKRYTLLLLVTWGLLSTLVALYFWSVSQHQERTNALLSKSISLHKQAIEIEAKSYYAINDCFVVNRGLCNSDEFKEKLQVLGDEADGIYNQISVIEKQLRETHK